MFVFTVIFTMLTTCQRETAKSVTRLCVSIRSTMKIFLLFLANRNST